MSGALGILAVLLIIVAIVAGEIKHAIDRCAFWAARDEHKDGGP